MASGNRSRRRRDWIALGGAIIVIVGALFWNSYALRTNARWFVWSQGFKQRVMAQASQGSELKHIAWDGWGFPGAGRTVIYLVFDPEDWLAAAAESGEAGRYRGVPCEVYRVGRLERNWYTVRFHTEETWGRRNRLDCAGAGH